MADDQFQYVKLPDGSYGKFPSSASDDQIRTVLASQFPKEFAAAKAGSLSPQLQMNRALNASPTQFEIARNPSFQGGSGAAFLKTLGGLLTPSAQNPYPGMGQEDKAAAAAQSYQDDQQRKAMGRSLPYRALAPVAESVGANVQAMEHGGDVGNPSEVMGAAGGSVAPVVIPELAKGIARAIPAVADSVSAGARKVLPTPIDELTGTSPKRIGELQSFPGKVETVRQTVTAAEQAAHKAASDAFPKFDKPIQTGRMIEKPAEGPILVDEFGEHSPKAQVPETTTWNALQEQRSNLLKGIADEKRAVMRGSQPRFDLADMYKQLSQVDATMTKAAIDQGGAQGLAQLQSARAQFSKYMQDFHNQGSPLRGILETKPGETNKVVSKLLAPDAARAMEALRSHGVDTSGIQSLLQQGDRPVRVASIESAKLRKAGSVDAYSTQRLKESLSQATTNEMPSAAQARLPASAMSSKPAPIIGNIPVIGRKLTPRNFTAWRLRRALGGEQ